MSKREEKLSKMRSDKFATAYVGARDLIDDAVSQDKSKRILLRNLTDDDLIEYKKAIKVQKRQINRELLSRSENFKNLKKAGQIAFFTVLAIGTFLLIKEASLIVKEQREYILSHPDEVAAMHQYEELEHPDKPGVDLLDAGAEAVEDVVDFFKGLGGK